jgi:hypothetical protein
MHPVRIVLLALVVTLGIATCSGSSHDGKTSWRGASVHPQRSHRR